MSHLCSCDIATQFMKCVFFGPFFVKYAPEGPLRGGGGTSVWLRRAASDGESPARSPLGLCRASVSAGVDTHTTHSKKYCSICKKTAVNRSVNLQIIKCMTLPELARKSQPAHCRSAGTDVFGWPASPWVGRDLEAEEETLLTPTEAEHQYIHESSPRGGALECD